jgi:hypothetical protein
MKSRMPAYRWGGLSGLAIASASSHSGGFPAREGTYGLSFASSRVASIVSLSTQPDLKAVSAFRAILSASGESVLAPSKVQASSKSCLSAMSCSGSKTPAIERCHDKLLNPVGVCLSQSLDTDKIADDASPYAYADAIANPSGPQSPQ